MFDIKTIDVELPEATSAILALAAGEVRPYDSPEDGTPSTPAVDWAHEAARGIFYTLESEKWVGPALALGSAEDRVSLIKESSNIIRVAAQDLVIAERKAKKVAADVFLALLADEDMAAGLMEMIFEDQDEAVDQPAVTNSDR